MVVVIQSNFETHFNNIGRTETMLLAFLGVFPGMGVSQTSYAFIYIFFFEEKKKEECKEQIKVS